MGSTGEAQLDTGKWDGTCCTSDEGAISAADPALVQRHNEETAPAICMRTKCLLRVAMSQLFSPSNGPNRMSRLTFILCACLIADAALLIAARQWHSTTLLLSPSDVELCATNLKLVTLMPEVSCLNKLQARPWSYLLTTSSQA
jgi:hypothetical protein